MPFKFSNAATATLSSSITSTTTSITVATGLGGLFPSLSAGESFRAALIDSSNNIEIVDVTARTSDVMTVARGQEGTAARAFSSGSRFEMRLTSAALTNFVQLDGAQTISGQKTFSQTIIGNLQGNVTGNVTGNAGTVTNGVYTSGDQTINGVKNFLSTSTRIGGLSIGSNEVYLYESAANAFAIRTGSSASGYKYFGLSASGDMTVQGAVVATGDVTAFSDERLKQNWRELDAHFLSDLATVKVGIYDRKDSGETQVGVGAQSLWAVLPQAVREDAAGYLSVAYGNAALAACVMLAREVEAIKAKLGA